MKKPALDLSQYQYLLDHVDPVKNKGWVKQVIGNVIESEGPAVQLGELCYIHCGDTVARAEVVGFREHVVLLMPLEDITGIRSGSMIVASGPPQMVPVGHELCGRVIDPMGNPLDRGPKIVTKHKYPLESPPPNPMERQRIHEPLTLGVKALDSLLTCGRGQRLGIFSGSGVGKSTLMGMISRYSSADINVIGLIGERGREVRDFVEKDLGEEGLKRSVVLAVTSDQPALLRIKGAFAATAVAEYFRDQGLNVLLMMDSVTRFAMARREIGLAIGEPPATKGYTPSVYAILPKLLERSGNSAHGSITALYTVLVEGDDYNEPVSDMVRGILDGHIFLSRDIATQNIYPAIDILQSISRLAIELISPEHREAAGKIRDILAVYQKSEDLINIGAYVKGSNSHIDYAVGMHDKVISFLKQDIHEAFTFDETLEKLLELF